jgi:HSP20 family protein
MIVPINVAEKNIDFPGHPHKEILGVTMRHGYFRFSQSTKWSPALNLYEDERSFRVCVELPGLTREQVNVEVACRNLRIWGERSIPLLPEQKDSACMLRMEIDTGPFERVIELPETANMQAVEARLVVGFLWITIDKR